jgi:hypothetical protein
MWNDGIMEKWNDGFEGVFYIKNGLFPPLSPIFQHSRILFFHSDGKNRLPLINLYFQ